MLKKGFLTKTLCLAAVLLMICAMACAESAPTQANPLAVITPAPGSMPAGYDPASEESGGDYADGIYDAYGNLIIYAGATPIPLDPIDMPTPTPRPELTFSYTKMKAEKLGIQFEAPGTWTVDDTQERTFILTDPTTLDNINASLTLKLNQVASNYTVADIKTDLKNMLSEISQYNYPTWESSDISARTLMGKDGYYVTYRGEMYDGTIVRGRIHMSLLDGHQVLVVHLNAPGWFNSSYVNVYTRFRNTVEAIK